MADSEAKDWVAAGLHLSKSLRAIGTEKELELIVIALSAEVERLRVSELSLRLTLHLVEKNCEIICGLCGEYVTELKNVSWIHSSKTEDSVPVCSRCSPELAGIGAEEAANILGFPGTADDADGRG